MNNLEPQCVSTAKVFETIVLNLKDLVERQEARLHGLQELNDKLIGQSNVAVESVPMSKSNVPIDSLQGQLEESISLMNRIGNETDKILQRLHDKI